MTEFTDVTDAPKSYDLPLLESLARDLSALNYTVDGVRQLLGDAAQEAFNRDQMVPALLATTNDGGPLATVVRLWLLAEPVAPPALAAALPETGVAGLLALGLAREETDPQSTAAQVVAAVDLRPYGWPANSDGSGGADLWVASDLGAHQRAGVLPKDHVLGIGQASLTLAQSTIRHPVERALDLGTGCGIQTFHLLHHAQHVVATDISDRALAFTRFNLLLNAGPLLIDPRHLEDRVELRRGSLLEPVRGDSFDLVVSNPPFVITPRHQGESDTDRFTYRDGGMPGDDLVAVLVAELPRILSPAGWPRCSATGKSGRPKTLRRPQRRPTTGPSGMRGRSRGLPPVRMPGLSSVRKSVPCSMRRPGCGTLRRAATSVCTGRHMWTIWRISPPAGSAGSASA